MATRYKKGPRVGGQRITLTLSVLCKASCKHTDPGARAGGGQQEGGGVTGVGHMQCSKVFKGMNVDPPSSTLAQH